MTAAASPAGPPEPWQTGEAGEATEATGTGEATEATGTGEAAEAGEARRTRQTSQSARLAGPLGGRPLIVCDLDGTLLRPDGTASAYTRDALNRLAAAGVALTIATARGVPSIRALLAGVELPLPVVELGGAYLSDAVTGEHFVHHTLDREVTVALVDALELAGIEPTLTSWDGTADHVDFGELGNDSVRWFHAEKAAKGDRRLRYCADFGALARSTQVVLARLAAPHDDAERVGKLIAAVCGDRASVLAIRNDYCPGWTEFSVAAPTADKGTAVRGLRERLGHTGPLAVCGDHLNDLSMFAVATGPQDRRIVPSNAHPDVLALATEVTGPSDADGVARHLVSTYLPC